MSQRGGRPAGRGGGSGRGGGAGQGQGRGRGYDSPRGDRGGDRGGRGGGRGRGEFQPGRGRGAPALPTEDVLFNPPNDDATPWDAVSKAEDALIESRKALSLQALKLTGPTLPPRPGYGTLGAKVVLRANYFHMLPDPNQTLFRYAVDVSPSAGNERKKRRLFQLLLQAPTFAAMRDKVATDYSSTLVTATKLNLGEQDTKTAAITYTEEDDDPTRPRTASFNVRIQLSGKISTTQLLSYLASTDGNTTYGDKDETIQVLNIVMSRVANLQPGVAARPRRNKYFLAGQNAQWFNLRGGLIALRGYYASVRTATLRVLLNVNVCTAAFYQPVPLVQLMDSFFRENGGMTEYSCEKLERFLRMVRVETNHLRNKKKQPLKKVKTIVRLCRSPKFGNPDRTVFKLTRDNGPPTNISVTAYFSQEHNKSLQRRDLPVVDVGNKERSVYLPPEVCTVLPGQTASAALSPAQTAEMIKFAARRPAVNAGLIVGEGADVLGMGTGNDGAFTAFGIKIRARMVAVHGRILNPPQVMYQKEAIQPQGGSWNMVNKKFNTPMAIKDWSFLVVKGEKDVNFRDHIQNFVKSLNACGVQASNPNPLSGYLMTTRADSEADKAALRTTFETISKGPAKMLLIILPSTDTVRYARIKYFCDTVFGIHNVCVVANKFTNPKGQAMYMANVALKFNLKRGGANHILPTNKLGVLQDGKTMVVGIDVTHPSAISVEGAPSIAGVVASVDALYAQWPASIAIQESRKEMVTDLENMMVERLRLWQTKNKNALPQRILVYRDGVSEGQYETVLREELPCIQKACNKLYPANAPKPKMSIVVVGKRHHTRFYPTKQQDADRNGNPKNGTVVDRGVTSERHWDFFLQAHTGLQGTARPAHYIVLRDEIGLGADGLEQLTHNLCYLFGRATKSVSICPPAYYADLLCERGRCYLHDTLNGRSGSTTTGSAVFDPARAPWRSGVHANLKDRMFYI